MWLDEPLDWQRLPPRFRISGWCFSTRDEPIHAIRAQIGQRVFSGAYGIFRADVATSHVDRPGASKSGFTIDASAPRGRAEVRIEVQHSDRAWQDVFRKNISAPVLNLRATSQNQLWKIGDYATWTNRYDALSSADRRAIKEHVDRFPAKPLISIVTPVYNPSAAHLGKRSSRFAPSFIRTGNSASLMTPPAPNTFALLTRYARKDARIKVHFREKNGGIAAASNERLA